MRLRNRDLLETRQELIEAGLRLLIRHGVDLGMSAVSLTAVAREADRTTGAAYQIWKTQKAFHRDLALEATRQQAWADPSIVDAPIASVLEASGPMAELVQRAGDAYMDHLAHSRTFYISVHFWGAALDDDELREAIKAGYTNFHNDFKQLYQGLLDIYGLQMREPLTVDDLTVAFTALAEGFALRIQMDPDAVRPSTTGQMGSFASSLYAIVQAMTMEKSSE